MLLQEDITPNFQPVTQDMILAEQNNLIPPYHTMVDTSVENFLQLWTNPPLIKQMPCLLKKANTSPSKKRGWKPNHTLL